MDQNYNKEFILGAIAVVALFFFQYSNNARISQLEERLGNPEVAAAPSLREGVLAPVILEVTGHKGDTEVEGMLTGYQITTPRKVVLVITEETTVSGGSVAELTPKSFVDALVDPAALSLSRIPVKSMIIRIASPGPVIAEPDVHPETP